MRKSRSRAYTGSQGRRSADGRLQVKIQKTQGDGGGNICVLTATSSIATNNEVRAPKLGRIAGRIVVSAGVCRPGRNRVG